MKLIVDGKTVHTFKGMAVASAKPKAYGDQTAYDAIMKFAAAITEDRKPKNDKFIFDRNGYEPLAPSLAAIINTQNATRQSFELQFAQDVKAESFARFGIANPPPWLVAWIERDTVLRSFV